MATHMAGVNPGDQASPAGRRKRVSDAEWAAEQSLMYSCMSAVKAVDKKKARERTLQLAPRTKARIAQARKQLEERHAKSAAANPKFTISFSSWVDLMATVDPAARLVHRASQEVVWGDIRRQRAAILKAEVATRIKHGYHWDGGEVAGNAEYVRPAVHYQGLVSSEHPILQHFVTKLRRVKNLRIGADKTESIKTQSKLLACDEAYIESNKRVIGVVRVELDSTTPAWAVEDACNDAGCPLPNILVGYEDEYGEVHNPHLIWLLHDSIPVHGPKHAGNAALVRGVARGLTKALLSIGADVGGLSNSARHKNPLSPLWNRHVLAQQPYELSELAEAVDSRVTLEALQEAADQAQGRSKPVLAADHPVAAVASGSNRLFRALSAWAREAIVDAKQTGDEEAFKQAVTDHALQIATGMTGDSEASEPAARKAAASVSRWTWHEYRIPGAARAPMAAEEIQAKQSAAAKATSDRRRDRTKDLVVSTAMNMVVDGKLPQKFRVAEAIVAAGGKVNVRTVRRHWDAVEAAYEATQPEDIRSPSVKENHLTLPRQSIEVPPSPVPSSSSVQEYSPDVTVCLPANPIPVPVVCRPVLLPPTFPRTGKPARVRGSQHLTE